MIVIGVDPHKSTHTATALDPATNSDVGSLRIEASLAEYQRLTAEGKLGEAGQKLEALKQKLEALNRRSVK